MPTILNRYGFRFYFYSDEHLSILVHVENGDGRMKIVVEPDVYVVSNEGIKPKDVSRALAVVRIYRSVIISAWRQYHG